MTDTSPQVVPDNEGGFLIGENQRIPPDRLSWSAIRAQGPGGQHVNKASTAVQLRLDVTACDELDDEQRERLLALRDRRMSKDGVITIKAQRYRSREKNRYDALDRLCALIAKALTTNKPRKATKPSRAARERRLQQKGRRGKLKALRRTVDE